MRPISVLCLVGQWPFQHSTADNKRWEQSQIVIFLLSYRLYRLSLILSYLSFIILVKTLTTFLNNKKIPFIPPIYHNNNYITDFKEKAQIFNYFFDKKCTLVENSSELPTNSFKRTTFFLSTISFTKDDMAKSLKILIRIKPTALT